MRTDNTIVIEAPLAVVYPLAAAVERWPDLLPHYRFVRVHAGGPRRRVVEMAARRGWFPVWWMAVQECDPSAPRISYRHVHGITRGMAVEWSFREEPGGVRVAIRHEFSPTWPVVGGLAAGRIIGPGFVEPIAGRTLAGLKARAERRAGGTPG